MDEPPEPDADVPFPFWKAALAIHLILELFYYGPAKARLSNPPPPELDPGPIGYYFVAAADSFWVFIALYAAAWFGWKHRAEVGQFLALIALGAIAVAILSQIGPGSCSSDPYYEPSRR